MRYEPETLIEDAVVFAVMFFVLVVLAIIVAWMFPDSLGWRLGMAVINGVIVALFVPPLVKKLVMRRKP